MSIAVMAMLLCVIGAFVLKGMETYLSRSHIKSKSIGTTTETKFITVPRSELDCEVYDQRSFERRMVEAGLMDVHELTSCGDEECTNCFVKVNGFHTGHTRAHDKDAWPVDQAARKAEREAEKMRRANQEETWAGYDIGVQIMRAKMIRAKMEDPDGNGWGLVFLKDEDLKREYQFLLKNLWEVAPDIAKQLNGRWEPDYAEIEVDQLLDTVKIFKGPIAPDFVSNNSDRQLREIKDSIQEYTNRVILDALLPDPRIQERI